MKHIKTNNKINKHKKPTLAPLYFSFSVVLILFFCTNLNAQDLPKPLVKIEISNTKKLKELLDKFDSPANQKGPNKLKKSLDNFLASPGFDNERNLLITSWSQNLMGKPPLVVAYLPYKDLSFEQIKENLNKQKPGMQAYDHGNNYARIIAMDNGAMPDQLNASEKMPTAASSDALFNFTLEPNQVIRDTAVGLLQVGISSLSANNDNLKTKSGKKIDLQMASQMANLVGPSLVNFIKGLKLLKFEMDEGDDKLNINFGVASIEGSEFNKFMQPMSAKLKDGYAYDENAIFYINGKFDKNQKFTEFYKKYMEIISSTMQKQEDKSMQALGKDLSQNLERNVKLFEDMLPGIFAGSYSMSDAGLSVKSVMQNLSGNSKDSYQNMVNFIKDYAKNSDENKNVYKNFTFKENVRNLDDVRIDSFESELNMDIIGKMKESENKNNFLKKLYPDGKVKGEMAQKNDIILSTVGNYSIDSLIQNPKSNNVPDMLKAENNTTFIAMFSLSDLIKLLKQQKADVPPNAEEIIDKEMAIYLRGNNDGSMYNFNINIPIEAIKQIKQMPRPNK